VFYRSSFAPLAFLFWPLCCLSFFDIRIMHFYRNACTKSGSLRFHSFPWKTVRAFPSNKL